MVGCLLLRSVSIFSLQMLFPPFQISSSGPYMIADTNLTLCTSSDPASDASTTLFFSVDCLFLNVARFLSDSMGQDPLIDDETCTTRLPTDVDEDAFNPASMSLPPPRPENNSAYFIQKCRYVLQPLLFRSRRTSLTLIVTHLPTHASIMVCLSFPN